MTMYSSDESYLAEINGRNMGHMAGRRQGQEEGYQQGYDEGRERGYRAGVNEQAAHTLTQIEYTRQHIAEKEQLKVELAKQQEVIEQLEAKITALARENRQLLDLNARWRETDAALREIVEKYRKTDAAMREMIASLKEGNQRLHEQVAELDTKYQQQNTEHVALLRQYNRTMVFMNAVCNVLDRLTDETSPHADHVRHLFAEEYAEQVIEGIEEGAIKRAPDQDEEFMKTMPKTWEFIMKMKNFAN
jgi:chromosome segregation ATPase